MCNKYFLIIVFFFTSLILTFGQKCVCSIPIFTDADSSGRYFKCPLDTEIIEDVGGKYIKCFLKDCKGAMKFYAYADSVLIIEGNYINSLDTLKACSLNLDPNNPGKYVVVVDKYFQPLKDGIWIYYNKKGIKIKEEIWDKGVPIDSKKY